MLSKDGAKRRRPVPTTLHTLFCEGSHRGTDFAPMEFKTKDAGVVPFCDCKRSSKARSCDRSHKNRT